MRQCRFVFCGAEDDEPFSVLLPVEPAPTLQVVRSHFPFEGRFHFRLQEVTSGGNYVWRDLVDESTVVPIDALLKVLQVSSTPEEYPVYSSQVDNANELESFQRSFREAYDDSACSGDHERSSKGSNKQPQQQSSSAAPQLNALWKNTKHHLNKTTAKVWETVEFTAGRYFGSQSGAEKPTAAALQNLAAASALSRTPFSDSNRDHMDQIRRLWGAVVGDSGRPFARTSPVWVDEGGFPSDDPGATFKAHGVLALHALAFFTDVHRSASDEMRRGGYAYATEGLQVVSILVEVLDLDSGRFLERDEVYWKVFEDPIGWYELFSVAFHAHHTFWRQQGKGASSTSTRDRSFQPSPLDLTKQFVCRLLMQAPKTVQDVVTLADTIY
ncbi:hypothetical protein DYB38_004974 [Aphanomyces astaci]|uniref:ELMO domain-containing protein n=1 Tax=Aphanomyces astaci TaxID=112090 RepID=A0A397E6U1_APHAT|nr:hypothetical protein DYB38_004974 [Aphanomyces astaci]